VSKILLTISALILGALQSVEDLAPVGLSATGPLAYPAPMSEVESEFGLEAWDTSDWGDGWCEYRRVPIAEGDTIRAIFVDSQLVRVDVRDGTRATTSGVRIGTQEADAIAAYEGEVEITPHEYIDGHYLTVRDNGHAIVMETDGQRVTAFRAGAIPYVEWVEGCS